MAAKTSWHRYRMKLSLTPYVFLLCPFIFLPFLSFLLSHFLPLLSLPLPLFLPFPHKSSREIWGSTVNSPSRSGRSKAKWFLVHSDTETKQFCTCVLDHFDMLLHAEFSDACGTKITASHPLVLAVGVIAPWSWHVCSKHLSQQWSLINSVYVIIQ